MIEMQHYWDKILECKKEIERAANTIVLYENNLAEEKKKLVLLQDDQRKLSSEIKKNELELNSYDEKISKLEGRRVLIKSERELEALNTELDKNKKESDEIEENLIQLMDTADELSAKEKEHTEKIKSKEKQTIEDIKNLKKKIDETSLKENENQIKFDKHSEDLTPSLKVRFLKLLNSKGGKAIGEVKDDICNNCNFQVPSSLTKDAASDDKTVICTNCGRFIYAR